MRWKRLQVKYVLFFIGRVKNTEDWQNLKLIGKTSTGVQVIMSKFDPKIAKVFFSDVTVLTV